MEISQPGKLLGKEHFRQREQNVQRLYHRKKTWHVPGREGKAMYWSFSKRQNGDRRLEKLALSSFSSLCQWKVIKGVTRWEMRPNLIYILKYHSNGSPSWISSVFFFFFILIAEIASSGIVLPKWNPAFTTYTQVTF